MKQQYRFWLMGVVALVVVVLAVAFTGGNAAGPEQTLALQPPAFVQAASSETSGTPAEIAAMLSDEAGISAYMQASGPIDLSQVEGEFNTIETQTADYIIGSVSVPDYNETYDVHVYVHVDGWVLTYYSAEDPASKIIDWRSYDGTTIDTTKLRNVLFVMASEIGSPLSDLFYYDFRYPNATNMVIVAEHRSAGGTDSFGIRLPGTYGYYESSWHFATVCRSTTAHPKLLLDGELIAEHGCSTSWTITRESYGVFAASQLMPDKDHLVEVHEPYSGNAYGALIIIYRVP